MAYKSRMMVFLLLLSIVILGVMPVTAATTVIVDPGIQYQTMEGWGTSLCWWGNVVGKYPDAPRLAIEDLLFNSSSGIGLNIARYNIGGGENPSHEHMRAGGEMEGFEPAAGTWNWNADAGQRKILTEIIPKGVNIVEAFSNSPPYWMTNSSCASGATVASNNNLKDTQYVAFADYLTEVVKHFRDSWGITFRTLDPLNESYSSYWAANGGQEGCHFDRSKQNQIIKEVGARLSSKGLTGTKVSAPDESVIDDTVNSFNSYDSTAKAYIAQINTHTYGGSNRYGVKSLALSTGKRLWMSEVDNGGGVAHNHTSITPGLSLAQAITVDMKDMQPIAWVFWQAVENEQNMLPGRENSNWGLIHSDFENGGSNYYITKKYYVMGNYSKFIRPGYKMIGANESKTVAAFDPVSSKLVIVVYNNTSSAVSYTYDLSRFTTVGSSATVYRTSASESLAQSTVAISNKTLSASANANSVTTYVISGATIPSIVYYKIINRNSGKLLDVSGESTADNAKVDQWTGNGGLNQQWRKVDLGNGTFKFFNRNSGKLLDVSGGSTADGAQVVQYTDNGGTNQQWRITDLGGGYYKIINVKSGKLLDISGASTADGAQAIQWTDNGGTNQQWSMVQVP